MRTVIETIPHEQQRYDTVGDWFYNDLQPVGNQRQLVIRVSKMRDWRSEVLVAVHELVEALLCHRAGITSEQVDAWDMPRAAADREQHEPLDYPEPGDDPECPYHEQHTFATAIERMLAFAIGLGWVQHTLNCQICWERDDPPSEVFTAGEAGKDPVLGAPYGKPQSTEA